jgi:hypothetical protein
MITLSELLAKADMVILTNGDVVSWFDPSDDDIKQKKCTLYKNNIFIERVSVDRKIEKTPNDTYQMLLDSNLIEFRAYSMNRVDV